MDERREAEYTSSSVRKEEERGRLGAAAGGGGLGDLAFLRCLGAGAGAGGGGGDGEGLGTRPSPISFSLWFLLLFSKTLGPDLAFFVLRLGGTEVSKDTRLRTRPEMRGDSMGSMGSMGFGSWGGVGAGGCRRLEEGVRGGGRTDEWGGGEIGRSGGPVERLRRACELREGRGGAGCRVDWNWSTSGASQDLSILVLGGVWWRLLPELC